ncbi:MAG: hypothetical protein IRY99_07925 [Isosphaeraceae bacterium]|nr:hypothetical protein [Isosphaeraceae bacterium]
MAELIRASCKSGKTFPDDDWIRLAGSMDEHEIDDALALPDDQFRRYKAMRLDGQSHTFALMLATKRFPGIRTDSTFNVGRVNGNQFEDCPLRGDYYKRMAEAAGVSTTGKFYSGALARFPGDPEAWISGRGDVERLCRERGWNCSGDVTVRAPRYADPITEVKLDPSIVDDEVDARIEAQPELASRRSELWEQTYALRSGAVDPSEGG